VPREPRDPPPTVGGRALATRLQIENMASSVDERTDGIYATMRSGTVDLWILVGRDLFALTEALPNNTPR
jgi:hypothetical protein